MLLRFTCHLKIAGLVRWESWTLAPKKQRRDQTKAAKMYSRDIYSFLKNWWKLPICKILFYPGCVTTLLVLKWEQIFLGRWSSKRIVRRDGKIRSIPVRRGARTLTPFQWMRRYAQKSIVLSDDLSVRNIRYQGQTILFIGLLCNPVKLHTFFIGWKREQEWGGSLWGANPAHESKLGNYILLKWREAPVVQRFDDIKKKRCTWTLWRFLRTLLASSLVKT